MQEIAVFSLARFCAQSGALCSVQNEIVFSLASRVQLSTDLCSVEHDSRFCGCIDA